MFRLIQACSTGCFRLGYWDEIEAVQAVRVAYMAGNVDFQDH